MGSSSSTERAWSSPFDEQGDLVKVIGDLGVACRTLFDLATAGEMIIVPDEGNAYVTTTEAPWLANMNAHVLTRIEPR
jgi:hypothetical protein